MLSGCDYATRVGAGEALVRWYAGTRPRAHAPPLNYAKLLVYYRNTKYKLIISITYYCFELRLEDENFWKHPSITYHLTLPSCYPRGRPWSPHPLPPNSRYTR